MTRLLAPGGPDAVAVLLVGDELLLGTVADTNGAWLARSLTSAGLRVVAVETVPDDVGRIADAVARLSGRAGSVIVSGGIGPTSDDLTREALAAVAGCELVEDDAAAAAILQVMARYGRRATPEVMRMARRPTCGSMIVNPVGSAPGVRLALQDSVVYAMPGVPSELRSMLEAVVPDLLARAGPLSRLHSATVEVSLLGESSVSRLLGEVEADVARRPDVDLAYLARPARVSVRVTVRAGRAADSADATKALQGWLARVTAALGEHVLGPEGTTLAQAVVESLARCGQTVAAAESLTAGAVVRELTTVPGSSSVVRGGVTAYATELKTTLLDVAEDLLAAHGPVHPDVALAMAHGVRRRLGATWGLATTGVAGPDPVGDHLPGEVHVAVAGEDEADVRSLQLPGDRERVRTLASAHVLDRLRRRLLRGEWPAPRRR